MDDSNRDALRALLRRVDEVRGLSDQTGGAPALDLDDRDALVRTLGDLVGEVERSHRRLIETNVQLVSLREVASRLAMTSDAAETTRTVARYLQLALGFDQVGLLLVDRERGVLTGAWSVAGRQSRTESLEVPLVGERGCLARTLWLNRTILHRDPRRHPPTLLPAGHSLAERFETLGSLVSSPLPHSQAVQARDHRDVCGVGCAVGAASWLAPAPGLDPAAWAS